MSARRSRFNSEWLESRTCLTGNVQAVVFSGNLMLTGDADNNEVAISFDSSTSRILVTGQNGTTINGLNDVFVAFSGSQRLPGLLNAELGDGDDVLSISDTVVLDNIEIRGGDGDDTIALSNAHSGDNVEIDGGTGDDRISIDVSGIDDNLHLDGGEGNDTISIEVSVVDDFAVIHGGAGDDIVALNQLSVGDDLTIDLGSGNDTLLANRFSSDDNTFLDSGDGDDTLRIADGFIKDNMELESGSGADHIIFRNHIVIDDLRIDTGDGDDTLDFSESLAQDNLFVTTGTGADTFIYDQSAVDDLIHLRTESGADTVVFSNSVFHHNLFLDTGADNDLLFVEPSVVGDAADIQLGDGDDQILFDGANTFGMRLTVNAGSGADSFEFDPATDLGRNSSTTGVESNDVDNAAIDAVLNDLMTGLLTQAIEAENQLLGSFAPAVADDSYGTTISRTTDAASGVLSNDQTSVLGGTLTATLLTGPSSGVITLNSDGSFTYTANDGFLGNDSFTYLATDAFGATAQGTVTIVVEELDLSIDTSSNGAVISNDTLIVDDANFVVTGLTGSDATIEVDSDGDGNFDDATATSDGDGNFSITVPLTNGQENRGAHNVQIRASKGPLQATQNVDVHFAVGSVVRFTTPLGTYDVELLDSDAPQTVTAFLDDLGRYDNSIVHRSPSDFVIQGGGFTVDGDGNVGNVTAFTAPPNEFSSDNLNDRGTLSTAQIGGDINSFTGQWFVNVVDNNFLDNVPHTVFGRVIGSGMDVVDAINNLPIFNLAPELGQSALGELPLQNYTPFSVDLTGTVTVDAGSASVTGTGTAFTSEASVGFNIQIAGEQFLISSIQSDTQLTLNRVHVAGATNVAAQINSLPVQSNYITSPISQLF